MAGYSVTFTVVDQATRQIEAINQRVRQMRAPMERQSRAIQQFVDVSGLRKVADGFASIGRAGLNAFSSLTRLVPVMGALTGAASIAGLVKLVNTWGQFGLGLQRDADRIGTTAQQLQVLRDATTLAGGSADSMVESLKALTDASAAAFTGRDPQALAWFNRANIALTDVNGNLRSSTELLPEVINYISSLKNPTDQMTAAMGLGGQSLYNVTENFRRAQRPGETLIDTYRRLTDQAGQYGSISNAQIAAQQRYAEAVGALRVSFEHLNTEIGTVLAEALTPLVREFGEWVRIHQPQIRDAVEQLAAGFREWVTGIDWVSVRRGADDVLRVLRFLIDNLNTIIRVGEAVAVLFAIKWAGGIVSSIGQVVTALGTAGKGGGGGGTGLLGALSTASLLAAGVSAATGRLAGAVQERAETKDISPGRALAEEVLLPDTAYRIERVQRERAAREAAGDTRTFWQRNAPTVLGGRAAPPPPATPPVPAAAPAAARGPVPPATGGFKEKAGELTANLQRRLGLEPHQAAGLVGNLGYESAGFRQLQEGRPTSGRGGYGYAQWTGTRRRDFERWAAENSVDPSSHEANEGFLVHELQKPEWRGYLNRLRNTRSVEESTRLTHKEYENPADVQGPSPTYVSAEGRLRYARQAHELATTAQDRGLGPQYAAANENRPAAPAAVPPAPIEVAAAREPIAPAAPSPIILAAATPPSAPFAAPAPVIPPPPAAAAPEIALNMPRAEGAPAQVTGGPPVSGAVDITVTHRNPPPGATVTARGEGDVNVAAPRTEQQQLAAA